MSKDRVEAFSDGVFAVAITLLVLDLRVAGPGHRPLTTQLADQWPSYFAYIVSFMVIGIIWVNHHTLLGTIRDGGPDTAVPEPAPAHVHHRHPVSDCAARPVPPSWRSGSHVAAALYSVVMEGMGLSFTLMFAWGGRHPELLRERIDRAQYRASMRQFGLGSIVYLFTIALSFVSAQAALAPTSPSRCSTSSIERRRREQVTPGDSASSAAP